MTTRKIITNDGGNAGYWLQRKKGFRLIREAECAAERLADAPMYLHGGYDENDDVIAMGTSDPTPTWRTRSGRSRATRRPSASSSRNAAPRSAIIRSTQSSAIAAGRRTHRGAILGA
ncbi:hypothetical protein [Mesorhizobium mediterraneum]|uniref:hypothetical protein n=1 Tax=Mesorhizobium mediterraneum TaxID=43617 RepID=UPI00177FFFF6|nr:hypothetical protein [Mesorhizobium mediterraneum]